MIGRDEAHQAGTTSTSTNTSSCLNGLHCPHVACPIDMSCIWMQIRRHQCCLGLVDPEIRKIAVGPPPIDYRVRIDASTQRRLWLTECNKSVSLGSAGVLVSDDDGLKDVAELLKVGPHALLVRLPGKPAHEHLGERRVAELPCAAAAAAARLRPRHVYSIYPCYVYACVDPSYNQTAASSSSSSS
uniref:Uncharacterized protein n=1 Tax=Arundo donax TaxID=35708 RepID=A0A0A9HVL5_ARUDO